MNIEQTAEKIYSELYGSIDSKGHRANVQGEIEDWLTNGSLDDETLDELVKMFADFTANAQVELEAEMYG